MKKKILKDVLLFIVIFGATFLMMIKVITMNKHLLNILFLLIVSFCLIIFNTKTLKSIIRKTNKYKFFFLLLSLMIHVATSYFILTYLDKPNWPFDSKGASFLLMNNFYLWVKPFDVFFQQLLIVIFVTKFHQYKLSLKQIQILFVFGFGTIHIFQIFRTDIIISLIYIFVAIIFSFLFPYMILKVKNGYIFNYMIHLGIYSFAAFLFRMLY